MNFRRLAPQGNPPFSKGITLCAQIAGYKETPEKFSLVTRVNPSIEISFSNTPIAEIIKRKLETAYPHVSYLIRELSIAQQDLNKVDGVQMHMGKTIHCIHNIDSPADSRQFLIKRVDKEAAQEYVFPCS